MLEKKKTVESTMEALICRKLGDPTLPPDSSENAPFTYTKSYPIPKLNTPTSIRVRIISTCLNFATGLQVQGKYQEKYPLPFILGSDYSGIVESVGPNVTRFKIGDRVCAFAYVGSFAQFIVVEETELYGVPDGCDLLAASAIPVAYGTSHEALIQRANLKAGQVLLILGAAGGVGLSAIQIAKICGATVIAVVRGTEKVEFLKKEGVDHIVDLTKEGVIESGRAFLKTRNLKVVDVLYDPVGGTLTKESMKLLNWGAQILVIGFASGEFPVIPVNIALVKNWTIHGICWGKYDPNKQGVLKHSSKDLLSWFTKGLITINISHSYRLHEVSTFKSSFLRLNSEPSPSYPSQSENKYPLRPKPVLGSVKPETQSFLSILLRK